MIRPRSPTVLPRQSLAPKLTPTGFERATLDEALFEQVQQFYRGHTSHPEMDNDFISTISKDLASSTITQLPPVLQQAIHTSVQPIVEAWVGKKLRPTYVYGVRTYLNGAVLRVHVDRDVTHVVSAILNVDQKTSVPWPLLLQNEPGAIHPWRQVYLAPGELALYEGNRLQHGRPTPFQGEFFANVFIHYALT